MKIAHLYTLADPRTPKDVRYVGWTSRRPAQRMAHHVWDARRGEQTHRSRWIRVLLDLGQKPIMRVVAVCGAEEGPVAEIDLIAALRAAGHRLTNSTDGGEGLLGHIHSAETRAKMSASNKGKRRSPETRARIAAASSNPSPEVREAMSRAHLGKKYKPWTEERRAAASLALRGKKRRPLSAGHRASISAANLGKHMSDEARAKLASARRGMKFSPEHCAAMSRARLGKKKPPRTVEHRLALSRALRGKKRSPESRARMSESQCARFARKRIEEVA